MYAVMVSDVLRILNSVYGRILKGLGPETYGLGLGLDLES